MKRSRVGPRSLVSLALSLASIWALAAGPSHAEPASDDSKSGWQFDVTPYLWLSGLWGDLAVNAAVPPEHVSLSPWDVLSNLRFGAMGAVEARHGPFVVASDNLYVSEAFSSHIDIRGPGFAHASLKSKVFISTDLIGYRTIDEDGTTLDVLAGARLYNVDTAVELTGQDGIVSAETSKFWADPIVGLELRGPIHGKWSYSAYGDVGGFNAGSKLTGQVFAAVHYALSRRWSALAGWRYLSTDYDHDGFLFRTTLTGPVLGATYGF